MSVSISFLLLVFSILISSFSSAEGFDLNSCEARFLNRSMLTTIIQSSELPMVPQFALGKLERMKLPAKVRMKLPLKTNVTVREYRDPPSIYSYIHVFIDGEPVVSIGHRPNGYRETLVGEIHIARPLINSGLEGATLAELFRRYPNIDHVTLQSSIYDFNIFSPVMRPENIESFASSVGMRTLRFKTYENGIVVLTGQIGEKPSGAR